MNSTFQKNKQRYIFCLTGIYFLLSCLSPVLHNHYDYSVSTDSTASAAVKSSSIAADRSAVSIPCPACVFNNSNVGFLLSNTLARTGNFTLAHLPLKENHIQLSLLSSLHERAPPVTIS